MHPRIARTRVGLVVSALAVSWMAGCGVQDLDRPLEDSEEREALERRADAGARCRPQPPSNGCKKFDSSFAAIQELIFERHGCTASACHGQAKAGALDLRAEVAWENLIDVPSKNSKNARVQPGTTVDSFLYQKLQAATHPGSVQIAGSPMPVGTDALTDKELEAVALWIQKGAPKTGSVGDETKSLDVGKLLGACLPPIKPAKIKPLEPPAAEEGIQLPLPRYLLKANSEVEHCTPFAYDFTDRVPAQFKDAARNVMYVNSLRVRQDPQSHHLVVWNPHRDLASVTPDGTAWTCRGGEHENGECDPRQGSADCGEGGVCAGKTNPGTFCGVGGSELGGVLAGIDLASLTDPVKRAELLKDPAIAQALRDAAKSGALGGASISDSLANSQSPQEYIPPMDGVYWEVPLRGVMWFNSHAFNLEDEDTVLEARVNFYYASKREREMRQTGTTENISIAAGQPPFTRKSYCAKAVVPQGYSIAVLTGHTHRRGERFWVKDASGAMIYENFSYNDPLYKHFEPWLGFDAPEPAARTLEYCATFNNGLTKDDKPDLDLVTRASRMPDRTKCTPVACVAGKVTAACTTDRDCDSAPGANDGDCDACPITAGQTTENEMFVLNPWYVLPPKSAAPSSPMGSAPASVP